MSLLSSDGKSVAQKRAVGLNVLQYANEKRSEGTSNDVTIKGGTETIVTKCVIQQQFTNLNVLLY